MPKVTSLSFERGVSVEIKGIWHKVSCRIEIALEDPDQTPEKVAEVKVKGWNTVEQEVEKKILEIVNGQG